MIELITKIKNEKVLENAVKRYKELGIILPTFEQQRNPDLIPEKIKESLKNIGLWDLNPLNLFRITWKNDPVEKGGLFGEVNHIELPSSLTGVKARIVLLVGKWFPTGAHKVGAAYGCLAPQITTGGFDPLHHKAVWPSTGNYCRGGAYVSKLMNTESVAILPEEMSRERFDWLKDYIGSEVIATPGCESNVKEIYDKVWEIRKTREECVTFNQFDEFGNAAWHYNTTGPAMQEIYDKLKTENSSFSAFVSATGSAGTIASGDFLRTIHPLIKVVASEALQCPTLYNNGFGGHRIEGIGDKHVPWIHNSKNTNVVTAIDDEETMRLLRLFNEPEGHKLLIESGVPADVVKNLPLLGISSISNLLSAIKAAKYYEMTEDDFIFTIATDSADMYQSRLVELTDERGKYSEIQAAKDFDSCLISQKIDYLQELTFNDQKRIHNLKYYTWIEQQAKELEDLNQLWSDRKVWPNLFNQVNRWDELIKEFNQRTGLLKNL
ncbi:MAG: pyridoxal-phosphate dependent enzyme [Bacteroidales bacterium]|nr:pyridoxal-phosphate dependent enzyme [Bacteroidales bacterium]